MASGLEAFADTNPPFNTSTYTWTVDNYSVVDNGIYYFSTRDKDWIQLDEYYNYDQVINNLPTYGYRDITVKYYLRGSSSLANDVYEYSGYVELTSDLNINTRPNWAGVDFYDLSLESVTVDFDDNYSIDRSTYSPAFYTYGTYPNDATGLNTTVSINTRIYFDDLHITGRNISYVNYRFRLFFATDATMLPTDGEFLPDFVDNITATNSTTTSQTYSKYSKEYYLWNINNKLTPLEDILRNDNSGVADNLNEEAATAAAMESAADGAISNALPDADNELDSILSYDYSSISTDSLTAITFWKSLGDYILSNSNLVGIGALLFMCLFLGFVVYLFRL